MFIMYITILANLLYQNQKQGQQYPVSLKIFGKVSLKTYSVLNKYPQNPETFVSLHP